MVKEIRIYVEGGGSSKSTWRIVRTGFSEFLAPLRDLARSRGIRWSVVPGGAGPETVKDFQRALKNYPDTLNILLVDSEAQVVSSRVEHLRQAVRNLEPFPEDQCHLMVQTVEAWLVADPDALAEYYGQGFQKSVLPGQRDVEEIPKDNLLRSLNRAVAGTKKERYDKIHHCADILARLNRDHVRRRARHCDLLFRTLESLIQQS
jgi:hypothetical protein